MGIFCLVGAVATLIAAYAFTALAPVITRSKSRIFMACMYYITLIMLFLDPLYLSLLHRFVGGGDMNGIALILPATAAQIGCGVLLISNAWLFAKRILPLYTAAFTKSE